MADEEADPKQPDETPEASGDAAPEKKTTKKTARKAPAKKAAAKKAPAKKKADEKPPPAEEVAAEPFDAQSDKGPTVDMPPPGKTSTVATNSAGLAAACHLLGLADLTFSVLLIGFIAPLVLWLVFKDKDPEVDYHGKESINFQLNILFWSLVGFLLIACFGLGLLLLPVLSILEIVLIILATIAAANGERYRYPLIYRILQ